ncbi:MAG: N-acetyltransferase [Dehalococcoidales bacterium]|nr:N-acetyltransferase [Dehalococcoidales bacterium]
MAKIEKARIKDAPQIQQLINSFADNGEMLARPLSEIYENIRDFFVVREGDKVIACAAIHVNWSDLAEIKSVAVAEDSQRKGIGNRLIKACLKEAEGLGIPKVFCLTYKPDFFSTMGFSTVEKMTLPHKVWNECYRCPKFPNCDEVAMVSHMESDA